MTHGVGEPTQIRYPGGKDGWYRVACTGPGCTFSATEAYPGRAEARVREHATAQNGQETQR